MLGLGFIHTTPAEAQIGLIINQDAYHSEPSPELINGRVYVPLRTISEGLGYQVKWHGDKRAVCISTDGKETTPGPLGAGIQVYIDDKAYPISAGLGTPYIKAPGYTMVPLRAISQGLGAKCGWYDGIVTVQTDRQSQRTGTTANADEWLPGVQQATTVVPTRVEEAPKTETTEATPLPAPAPETTVPAVSAEPEIQAVSAGTDRSLEEDEATTLTLFGAPKASLEQINRFLAKKESAMRAQAARSGRPFVPFPRDIGRLYLELGAKYQLRGDVALAQAIQETGYFQFGNEVKPYQNNFCGLGAIGRVTTAEDLEKQVYSQVDKSAATLEEGVHGWIYASPAIGVEAHLQHLYSYATTAPLPAGTRLLDGRFQHGNRGKAVVWADLNGRWAVPGNGYGQAIVDNIWREMLSS